MSDAPAATFVLQFVSGRYQGTVVPLPDGAEIAIGRESDLDIVLQEDMVSRKHAKVIAQGGEIQITDLGSTNGTFVNGQKVKRARIGEGDRVLVGTSLMKVVRAEATTEAPLPRDSTPAPHTTRRPAAMQGRLEEVPLPDLLQLLAASRKTGVLAVEGGTTEGHVHFADGKVTGCALTVAPGLAPQKAFARLLAIDRGAFELRPAEEVPATAALDAPLEGLLMEGIRQLDEWRALAGKLPAPGAKVTLGLPLAAPLRALAPEDLDAFQLALEGGTFQALLDRAAASDADLAARLLRLAEKGYLKVVGP
jgi:pSer/pThr/pTyr-binding forkhead associated (FHA) protein